MKRLLFAAFVLFMIEGCLTQKEDYDKWVVALPEAREGLSYGESSHWQGEVLNWNTREAGKSIFFKLPEVNLSEYEYLVCEIYHI